MWNKPQSKNLIQKYESSFVSALAEKRSACQMGKFTNSTREKTAFEPTVLLLHIFSESGLM
jgi:hypothetical protein